MSNHQIAFTAKDAKLGALITAAVFATLAVHAHQGHITLTGSLDGPSEDEMPTPAKGKGKATPPPVEEEEEDEDDALDELGGDDEEEDPARTAMNNLFIKMAKVDKAVVKAILEKLSVSAIEDIPEEKIEKVTKVLKAKLEAAEEE